SGKHDRSRFENAVRRIIGYFKYPNYYKIDGKPVFMLYDVVNLIEGLGGLDKAKEALDWMREETVKAGFPGLYIQTQFGNPPYVIDGGKRTLSLEEMVKGLGIDGGTHYQMLCDVAHEGGMRPTFRDEIEITQKVWERTEKLPVDYFPHVSVGWDNTPRYKEMRYDDIDKGIMEAMIIDPATPDEIEEIMRKAKEYIDSHPSLPAPLITVNSWNEWTEGSYLEPDDMFGYGYLDAIKKVFCE
ncbi:MAG: glycoside hydrolase family 99-like domain-containing protein, partial [Firmicutes bacterium]|nr:glycoside hydrolase family 99-like domain-containing protein [Candidatus Colimorpha enterica]